MSELHHARLLLALLREDVPSFERLAAGPFDPDTFVRLARECDVQPWLHARLTALGKLDELDREARLRLDEARAKVRADNLLLLARAEQALDLLIEAGVEVIALKGLDVLQRFYRFDERTLDDVDLLVRRRDVAKTLQVLEAAGWQRLPTDRRDHYLRSSHHLPLPGPGPVVVDFEIHWNLVQSGRFTLDPEGLFARAEPLTVSGRPVLRLSDHDLAAHLLLHHFTHYFDRRLKWCIDLRFVAAQPSFEWTPVAERVREWGASVPVAMSVEHLARLFPDVLTGEVRRLFPVSRWRAALTYPLRSSHPLEIFRGTRNRRTQLLLAAALLESPLQLPGWMLHRWTRDRRAELSPLATRRRRTDRSAGGENRS